MNFPGVQELPMDIMSLILCWLPAKTLMAWRCVSKQWRSLIDSPHFIQLHLQCSNATSSNLSLIFNTKIHAFGGRSSYETIFKHAEQNLDCLYSLDFDKLLDHDDALALPLDKYNPMKCFPEYAGLTYVVGSCNGLILLVERPNCTFFILWNPTTGKYQKIPWSVPVYDEFTHAPVTDIFGFGYDHINQDYKVVCRVKKSDRRDLLNVYSLKNDSWHRAALDSFPYGVNCELTVLFNNAFHSIGGSDNDVLVAFDLGTEQCRELAHPEPNNPLKTLSVLGGCLSLTILHYKGYEDCCLYSAHVWVMKIYGIEDSWTKVCKVSHLPLSGSVYVKPLAYSRCRDKILLYFDDGDGLVWYDVKMKRSQNVKVSGAPRFYVTTFVVGSLVPLNNSVTDLSKRGSKEQVEE